MKILHIYKHALPEAIGGIETVIDNLATAQADAGHDVVVMALTKYGKASNVERNGYEVHLTKTVLSIGSTPFAWAYFCRLWRIGKKFDVINAHAPFPFADLCVLLCGLASRTVVTYHSDIVRQRILRLIYKPLMNLFFSKVFRIVATSPNYLSTSKVLKKFENKCDVISLGSPDLALVSSKLCKLDGSPDSYFLFVGEFRYYKGLFTLLEAAVHIDFDIVIAGAGALQKDLKRRARQLNLTNVHFVGRVSLDRKLELIASSIGVVFPSNFRSEAFGMTLIEGAIFSKPLISCELGSGTTYVNIHFETGMVVQPNDPRGLAKAMQELFDDPQLAERLGRGSRERYEKLFTLEGMVSAYQQLYNQTVLSCVVREQ